MKLNLFLLLCAIRKVSGSLHLSKSGSAHTKRRFTAFVFRKVV